MLEYTLYKAYQALFAFLTVKLGGIQIIIRILFIVNKMRAHLYYQNFARTSNLSLKSTEKTPGLLHPGVLIFIHEINDIFVGLRKPVCINTQYCV